MSSSMPSMRGEVLGDCKKCRTKNITVRRGDVYGWYRLCLSCGDHKDEPTPKKPKSRRKYTGFERDDF